ncbi:MAG: hypothetical protein DRR19_04460 [Candidatus Parabeggiatoa sp. nov. 1]|nr:MAG: hypothetical protein DRR19_04460 [Gammaproteobacteria bacterium]
MCPICHAFLPGSGTIKDFSQCQLLIKDRWDIFVNSLKVNLLIFGSPYKPMEVFKLWKLRMGNYEQGLWNQELGTGIANQRQVSPKITPPELCLRFDILV